MNLLNSFPVGAPLGEISHTCVSMLFWACQKQHKAISFVRKPTLSARPPYNQQRLTRQNSPP
jgi:hypothetical protein